MKRFREIERDGTWRAFTLAATAKKQGEYFYLDLSNSRRRGGGREFDEHQISLVADWFPFPGRVYFVTSQINNDSGITIS